MFKMDIRLAFIILSAVVLIQTNSEELCATEDVQDKYQTSCDNMVSALYALELRQNSVTVASKFYGLDFAIAVIDEEYVGGEVPYFPFSPFNKNASVENDARLRVCRRFVAHPGIRRKCCTLISVLCPEEVKMEKQFADPAKLVLPSDAFVEGREDGVQTISPDTCGYSQVQVEFQHTCDHLVDAVYELEAMDVGKRPSAAVPGEKLNGLTYASKLLKKQFTPNGIPHYPLSPCNKHETKQEAVARRRLCATMTALPGVSRRCCILALLLCAHEPKINLRLMLGGKDVYTTRYPSVDTTTTATGYWPPPTTSGYWPPVTTRGYWPPVTTRGYWPPVTTRGYWPPVTTRGYWPPVTTRGYWPPVTTTGYWPPVTTTGYGPPVTTTGYGPPGTTSSYWPPGTTSSYWPPGTTSSYWPPGTTSDYWLPPTTSSYWPPPTTTTTPHSGQKFVTRFGNMLGLFLSGLLGDLNLSRLFALNNPMDSADAVNDQNICDMSPHPM